MSVIFKDQTKVSDSSI